MNIDKPAVSVSITTVAALAGRRIDASDASPCCFPLNRVPAVRAGLIKAFVEWRVAELICSAACGADLVALAAAEELGIPYRIVLPFETDVFRRISVGDRPGDWEPLYDRLVCQAKVSGNLLILHGCPENEHAFSEANRAIVDQAALVSRRRLAFVVWEGRARPTGDATDDFRRLALGTGFEEVVILTC